MANLSRFTKDAIERKRYTVDYENWLDTGEYLSDFAIIVSPATEDELVADGAYASPDNFMITTYIGGGLRGITYNVSFIATTNQGQVKRDDIQIQVT
jgi:hypothetical protein